MGDTIPTRVMVPMADLCNEVGKRDKKIAALEAERDEWKRRCEALTALASDCDPSLNRYYLVACKCGWKGSSSECDGGTPLADTGDYDDVKCPVCGAVDPTEMQARILAIAEGRDNG